MKADCKCFACGMSRAIEASFPGGVDREAAEAILAIIAAHAGNLIGQLGQEALTDFSIRLAVARAFVADAPPAGSVH